LLFFENLKLKIHSDPTFSSRFVSAWRAWTRILGEKGVQEDSSAYEINCSGIEERRIAGVLFPENTAAVQGVVRIANEFRIPLYPISRGKNWGYGSRLPVCPGAVVVDLGRMNRIRNAEAVRSDWPVVEIEPGVTQENLHRFLEERKLPLFFNVTGSGLQTSLIGNSLERGVGYFGSRADDLCGLEVVLGTGELLRTGFGRYENAAAHHAYKHGFGPSLDGLFFQSNFGIVTAAGFRLMERRPCHAAMVAKVAGEKDLGPFLDALADLRRAGLLRTVVHVGNRERTLAALAPGMAAYLGRGRDVPAERLRAETVQILEGMGFGAWSAVGGVMGTAAEVRAVQREIRARLRPLAEVRFVTDEKIDRLFCFFSRWEFIPGFRKQAALLSSLKGLHGLCVGRPSDGALASVEWAAQCGAGSNDPDAGAAGLLYYCPVAPLQGRHGETLVRHLREKTAARGFVPYMTLNLESETALVCVFNLAFDRRDRERVVAAQNCLQEIEETLRQEGYYPYRLGIQQMARWTDEKSVYWDHIAKIKICLDPNGIIAPGRYSPL
jgi:4-cresol dehydrogenase (hydroxylating)